MKLNPAGAVVWATYLGGVGEDVGDAVAVDGLGNVYVAGITSPDVQGANNFPTTVGAAFPAVASTTGSAFVVKLDALGSRMVYGTYLPGVAGGGKVSMTLDGSGAAYVAGATSPAHINFPTTTGAFQSSSGAATTGIIVKLNPAGSGIVYGTYLGGTGNNDVTNPTAITVGGGGEVVITGSTSAGDFPVTGGSFQTQSPGYAGSAFVTKLNATGSGLIYSTYLGGSNFDQGIAVRLDSQGRAYILGQSNSSDFPTTPGAFGPAGIQPPWAVSGAANSFLASLSADGTSLVYGTYIVGAAAMDVDASGNAYVGGMSQRGFPVSAGAYQLCFPGGVSGGFAAEFSAGGALTAATYVDGLGTGVVGEMAVAPNGLLSIASTGDQAESAVSFLIDDPLQKDSPCLSPGVVNAADYYWYSPSEITAGELVTLEGAGIGPDVGVSGSPGPNDLLPTQLAGVQVFFDELAAPLLYVQGQQINAVAPWELAGRESTQVRVVYNEASTNSVSVGLLPAVPGLFYLGYESQQGAILNADGTINSPSNPAKAGDIIALFGTGGGPTSSAGATGGYWGVSTNTLLTLPVTVQIGNVNSRVLYAGAAPALLSSIFQINVQIPSNLVETAEPGSSATIEVTMGSQGTRTTVTVAVH